jgi:hypothetical protein
MQLFEFLSRAITRYRPYCHATEGSLRPPAPEGWSATNAIARIYRVAVGADGALPARESPAVADSGAGSAGCRAARLHMETAC